MASSRERLMLEQVTDPEIIRFTHLQNSEAWRSKYLTAEEYAEREKLLGSSAISTRNKCLEMQEQFPDTYSWLGLKYFVLKNKSLPETSKMSQIVSSCETLNRIGWMVGPESSEIRPVLSVCIGGVFTSKENRGKGYAGEMITRLNAFYDDLGSQPDAPRLLRDKIMFLYSEVGEYYSKFGYISKPVPVHAISSLEGLVNVFCAANVVDGDGRSLGFDDYEDLIELEKEQFQKSLVKLQRAHPNSHIFTVEPSLEIYQWFKHRDIFLASKVNPESLPPTKFGFALPDGSHVIWHHHWPEKALYIVKICINDDTINKEGTLKRLLAESVAEAARSGLDHLEFWDEEIADFEWSRSLFEYLESSENKENLYKENGSRSAIRPPEGCSSGGFIWDNNTKFCWF